MRLVVRGALFLLAMLGVSLLLAHAQQTAYKPGGGGGLTFLGEFTASAAAGLDITSGLNSTYDRYLILFNAIPSAANEQLQLLTDSDGGASFDTGASDYGYGNKIVVHGSTTDELKDNLHTECALTFDGAAVGVNASDLGGVNGRINVETLGTASTWAVMTYTVAWRDPVSNRSNNLSTGVCTRVSAAAINAIRIQFDPPSTITGTARLYGIPNS